MFLSGVKDDTLFKKPREIVHKNTRFNGDPFSKSLNKSQIQQAAALNAQVSASKMSSIKSISTVYSCYFLNNNANSVTYVQFKQGKVGPDGKELIPHESPAVNGYGYVATPSPAPGKWI